MEIVMKKPWKNSALTKFFHHLGGVIAVASVGLMIVGGFIEIWGDMVFGLKLVWTGIISLIIAGGIFLWTDW